MSMKLFKNMGKCLKYNFKQEKQAIQLYKISLFQLRKCHRKKKDSGEKSKLTIVDYL